MTILIKKLDEIFESEKTDKAYLTSSKFLNSQKANEITIADYIIESKYIYQNMASYEISIVSLRVTPPPSIFSPKPPPYFLKIFSAPYQRPYHPLPCTNNFLAIPSPNHIFSAALSSHST